MKLIIPGPPIPQMRPRFFMRGKHPCVYDPQTKEKAHVRGIMKRWIMNNDHEKAISLTQDQLFDVRCVFSFPIAKSLTTGQKNRFLWGIDLHSSRPDLDNCEKFLLDCGNGILWLDDCQIIRLSSEKRYAEISNTEINFSIIKPIELDKSIQGALMIFSPQKMEEFINHTKRLSNVTVPQNIQDPHFQLLVNQVAKFAATYADDLKKIAKQING